MLLRLPILELDPALRLVSVDADGSDGWTSYEHRSADVHRGVLVCTDARATERPDRQPYRAAADSSAAVRSLERRTRDEIARHFRQSPDTVFAFGLVYAADAPPCGAAELAELVDRFEESTGICVWVVAVATGPGSVQGVHTWARGFLFPLYDGLLGHLEACGYSVQRETKARRP
ncbi:MAG: hypothetical protein HY908_23725 [Myxococcales bacterium]|nr:hypothetical protein [Myxococcales bacterium]